jgi:hypothetical protein
MFTFFASWSAGIAKGTGETKHDIRKVFYKCSQTIIQSAMLKWAAIEVWLHLPPHLFFICAEDFESPSNFVWFGIAAPPIQQPHNPAQIPLDTNRNQKPQDDALTRPERPILCAASGPHLNCVQLVRAEHPTVWFTHGLHWTVNLTQYFI